MPAAQQHTILCFAKRAHTFCVLILASNNAYLAHSPYLNASGGSVSLGCLPAAEEQLSLDCIVVGLLQSEVVN
eukprot:1136819-Rhodomonas_salina.1